MGSQRVRRDEQLSAAQHFYVVSFDFGFVFVCVCVGGGGSDYGCDREPASQKRVERMRESVYLDKEFRLDQHLELS